MIKILAVLCQNPFAQMDGGTYAVRSSLRKLAEKGELFVTGYGADFDRQNVGGYRSAGSLGEAENSRFRFLKALAGGSSFSVEKYAGRKAQRRLRQILDNEAFAMVWYEKLQAAFAARQAGLLTGETNSSVHILRSHNIEHLMIQERFNLKASIRRYLLQLEASRLKTHELGVIEAMSHTFTISSEDRGVLANLRPDLADRISFLPVVPEGVENVTPPSIVTRKRVLFVGDCRWRPNLLAAMWIVERLAPDLYLQCPDVLIRLVGMGTASLNTKYSNVERAGFVRDLANEYRTALCTIVPVRHGGGVNIKVIESLGCGVPVVGTAFAQRGVDSEAYLKAESTEDFVSCIRRLANDPVEVSRLALAARRSASVSEELFETAWSRFCVPRMK